MDINRWITDAGLMRCSLAAQGVFVHVAAMAWNAPERGRTWSKASTWTIEDLARRIPAPADQVADLIHELIENGAIIERDAGYEIPWLLDDNNAGDSKQRRAKSPEGPSERFDEFWAEYPNKKCKKPARAIWARLGLDNRFDEVIRGLRREFTSKAWQEGYVPHPTTWLNQERWQDEGKQLVEQPDLTLDQAMAVLGIDSLVNPEPEKIEKY